ncbi:hypothetical protein QZM92_26285 [Burkholderia multivorans]|nr:hypothetical protein [Burkholderia multivorans]MDN7998065.1 hypothetical protein [Burkholderia multivorans]
MSDIRPTFQGEMQLMNWGESSSNGAWVKFWLNPDDLQVFRDLKCRSGKIAGQRFAAVLVEVGDDEQPVQQPERPKGGPLAILAGRLCQDAEFWRFATTNYGIEFSPGEEADECAEWIRQHCGVASRSEIDHNPNATAAFHEIRGAWIKWRRVRGLA